MGENVREDYYHQQFKTRLIKYGLVENIDFKQYVTVNPDFIFLNYSILGEIKKCDSLKYYKDAFMEIQKRTGIYDIHNFDNFFILTDKFISIYDVDKFDWDTPVIEWDKELFNQYLCRFENIDLNISQFLQYIKNNCSKIYVDANLSIVLDMILSEENNLSVQDRLYIILHLNDEPVYSKKKKELIYYFGEDEEYSITDVSYDTYLYIKNHILNKYKIKDIDVVKNYIRHNYSSHLSDNKKSNYGKYYTPEKLVNIVYEMVEPYLNEEDYVMDLACGCGAFMQKFNYYNIVGADIDKNSINVLDLMGYVNVIEDNTLYNINRLKYNKFGINEDSKIIIVGNPPYNDTTSKNKRYGTNAKSKLDMNIDEDVKSRDLGSSFLKAYAKLNVDYICVLHPLSYLIKKKNFESLKLFKDNYKLVKGVIFSSSEFTDLKGKTPFPIVAALYEKGFMDYDYIYNFEFDILDSDKKYQLSNFTTIDDLEIGKKLKYPQRIDKEHIKRSDIDCYQYNIRDTNSLMASGNLVYLSSNENNMNYCTVDFENLSYFAYLHNYRRFMKNNYLIGNLSPLVDKNKIEEPCFKDLMVIGIIVKEYKKIPVFDVDNKDSIIYTRMLINHYRREALKYDGDENFYQYFIDFVENKNNRLEYREKIEKLLMNYFCSLNIN